MTDVRPTVPRFTGHLVRPRLRIVAGVCAGFARHSGLPVTFVRTVTFVLALCGGAGVLLYGWLWATTPDESADAAGGSGSHRDPLPKAALTGSGAVMADTRTVKGAGPANAAADSGINPGTREPRRAPVTEILLGLALVGTAGALIANRLGAALPLDAIIPAIVALAGTGLAWRQFAELRSGAGPRSSGMLVRALGALVLVALGILLFFVTSENPNVWTVVVAALSVLVGVAVVVAPWAVRLTRDLADERAAREREAGRAEMAAHLHDSVLQTLALIQQKAGPHSDAARLARAQERDLRDWLFTGATNGPVDLAAELRGIATTVERDYAVHVDVVAVGSVDREVPDALLAAAREAILNAARHAGGSVSVYVESSPTAIEVSVTDRGPGFSIDAIPADRMGVRESIVARMQRAGGSATVRPGPGGTGTEIRLSLPLDIQEDTP
ncbi:PspC domain-containing protein [Cryobacterium sp. SO2]|uniref:ATP-binding protein n=1 Tax=Cryobacterium sp. SO2 TaxID=1897060 RepID=UPI00223D3C05|nr:ATP-binding protein [Cryobacterium sp. SO2]WEO78869.1 PspC domain-containing protein [Cryobacterium sp. SO2]